MNDDERKQKRQQNMAKARAAITPEVIKRRTEAIKAIVRRSRLFIKYGLTPPHASVKYETPPRRVTITSKPETPTEPKKTGKNRWKQLFIDWKQNDIL